VQQTVDTQPSLTGAAATTKKKKKKKKKKNYYNACRDILMEALSPQILSEKKKGGVGQVQTSTASE
jgi:hypothetical protein